MLEVQCQQVQQYYAKVSADPNHSIPKQNLENKICYLCLSGQYHLKITWKLILTY